MRVKDPRLPMFFSGALIILAILFSQILIMIILAGVVIAVSAGKKNLKSLISYISPLRILIPVLFLLNMFFYAEGTVYASLNLKIFELAATSSGIYRSTLICSRLTAIALSAGWLAVTLPPREFEHGLKKLGLPWKLAFIFSLTLKLVPEMKKKFRKIEEAQYSRGLKKGGNPIKRARRKIPIVIPFLASVSRHGFQLSQVLEARNFGSKRTYFDESDYKTLEQES
ncbi:MAG: energy-coupling factor transporter transmembrane component T [Candidatus Hadarchaeia archaeon]